MFNSFDDQRSYTTKYVTRKCFGIVSAVTLVFTLLCASLLLYLVFKPTENSNINPHYGSEPVIGFTGMRFNETDYTKINNYDLVKILYTDAIEKAGGVPLALPVLTNFSVERIKRQVELIDALIIQGGYDVTPSLYGEDPSPYIDITNYPTDIFLVEAVKQATARNIPILGICRGMQLVNVAFGGTLYQDLSYLGLPSRKHYQTDSGCNWNHTIKVNKGTYLAELFPNNETMWVNSFHHQAVKKIAQGFVVDAMSEDGVVESMHKTDSSQWVFATQFHPEMHVECNDVFLPIFKEVVKQAKRFRDETK